MRGRSAGWERADGEGGIGNGIARAAFAEIRNNRLAAYHRRVWKRTAEFRCSGPVRRVLRVGKVSFRTKEVLERLSGHLTHGATDGYERLHAFGERPWMAPSTPLGCNCYMPWSSKCRFTPTDSIDRPWDGTARLELPVADGLEGVRHGAAAGEGRADAGVGEVHVGGPHRDGRVRPPGGHPRTGRLRGGGHRLDRRVETPGWGAWAGKERRPKREEASNGDGCELRDPVNGGACCEASEGGGRGGGNG